jgi:uncharacterized protein YycO
MSGKTRPTTLCGLFIITICLGLIGTSNSEANRDVLMPQSPGGPKEIDQLFDFPFLSNEPMGSAKNPAVILPAATAALVGDLPAARRVGDLILVPIAELQKAANQPLVGSLFAPVMSQLTNARGFDGFSAIDATSLNPGQPSSILYLPNKTTRKMSGEDLSKTAKLLRNGDLVFGSHLFNWMTWGRYIHVAIVSDAARGKLLEATADGATDRPGVREIDWTNYSSIYGHVGVVRVKRASDEQIARVIRWIEDRKGRPYRWPILMGLDNDDESRFYCSQLIWLAYKKVMNIDLDSDKGALVFPDDLYYSKEYADVIVP